MQELKFPVQVLSEAEYLTLLQQHGFQDVRALRIPDRSPTPEQYSGKLFKNAEALLLIAQKP